jgi:hypothetical protein
MILHGTQGRISMRGKDGDWHDITAGVRDVDLTLSTEDAELIELLACVEFTITFTWQRWAPFALSLPPAGCVPMYN